MELTYARFYQIADALPRWACLAIASRSASRVPSRFLSESFQACEEDLELVREVLERSARAAAIGAHLDGGDLVERTEKTLKRAKKRFAIGKKPTIAQRAAVVNLGEYWARLHEILVLAKAIAEPFDPPDVAFSGTYFARACAEGSSAGTELIVYRALHDDVRRLRDAAYVDAWTDATAVTPDAFGAIWPYGEPPWPPMLPCRVELRMSEEFAESFSPLSPEFRQVVSEQLVRGRPADPQELDVAALGAAAERESLADPASSDPPNSSNALEGQAPTTLAALRNDKPTARWREDMADGDSNFSMAALRAADSALDEFLDALEQLGRPPSKDSALEAVKRVVERFNKLNRRHGSVVETSEREELCAFFDEALRAVGIEFDHDVTEEWRDW